MQFGTDTNYGFTTWTEPVPTGGGPVSLFVAGMKGNTLYHMRGVVQFADGTQYMDPDQTFTTQALPAAQLPVITTTTTPGLTPQSGVELLDLVNAPATVAPVAVTDLNGNVLWSYNPVSQASLPNPIKLLPNGHFLINFSAAVGGWVEFGPSGGGPDREVDLANDRRTAQSSTSGGNLRGMQYHGCRYTSRFRNPS